MKIKKREAMFFLCILTFVVCICAGIMIMLRKAPDEEAEKKTTVEEILPASKEKEEVKKEDNRTIKFENVNLLESVFMIDQIEDLKARIVAFLSSDTRYDSLEKVVCETIPISTEKKVEFYCVLEQKRSSILRVTYNKEHQSYRFWTEDITSDEMAVQWQKKEEKQIDTSGWETEEKLPIQWNYEEQDKTEVSIEKMELLEAKLSKEKLESLEKELLVFLQKNNEYRREMELQEDIEETQEILKFNVKFKTQRVDGKDLHIIYDKRGNTFQFVLQEG